MVNKPLDFFFCKFCGIQLKPLITPINTYNFNNIQIGKTLRIS